jgi:hypothetical protein
MMDESIATIAAEDDGDEATAGKTAALTTEGWEERAYVEPGDDWRLLLDGSYLSPDGAMRTWLLVGPGAA